VFFSFPRLGVIIFLAVIILALTPNYSVMAEEPSPPPPPPAWTHVYLKTFMAPTVLPGSRRRRSSAMTVILEVATDVAGTVCSYSPRIQDAVITELHRHPIRFDHERHLDVEPAEKTLLNSVNGVLLSPSVKRVLLIPGVRRITDVAAERLPHSNLQKCSSIKS
jgi:hypothetical protein